MATERYNLGATPQINIDQCGGDLEVRGVNGSETMVDFPSGLRPNVSTSEGSLSLSTIGGSCSLKLPEGATLSVGSVGGHVRLKGITGAVRIAVVGGECLGRGIGALSVDQIGGELHIRRADGEIIAGNVGGDASLRDCSKTVRIEVVSGDLLCRRVPAGVECSLVGGDIELRTSFDPEAQYHLHAGSDAIFRVPADSNATFVFPSDSDFKVDDTLKPVYESDKVFVTMGSGSARVEVDANSSIRVRISDMSDDDREKIGAVDEDLENYMVDVSARIDAELNRMEFKLEGLPERIRNKVENKLNAARRQVEAAHNQVRNASERHMNFGGIGVTVERGMPASGNEEVSPDERMAVLKMLEEGKITVDEAQKLLTALEGGS